MNTEVNPAKEAVEKQVMDMSGAEMPQGWIPQEGDKVVGTITQISEAWSKESESFYPVLWIDAEEIVEKGDKIAPRPMSVHAFHVALQGRLRSLDAQPGDRIGIVVGPKIPLKSRPSQSVVTYTVKIEGKTGATYDWGKPSGPRGRGRPDEVDEIVETAKDDDIPF